MNLTDAVGLLQDQKFLPQGLIGDGCVVEREALAEAIATRLDQLTGWSDLLAACKAFMSGPPAGVVEKMRAAIAKAEA